MRTLLWAFGLLLICSCSTNDKKSNKTIMNSLLVAHFEADGTGRGVIQRLVSYNFQKGELISKDTIYTVNENEFLNGSNVSFGFNGHMILKNQYAVSRWGDVIDISRKLLINRSQYKYLETNGDRLLFYKTEKNGHTSFMTYDMETREYDEIEDPFFRLTEGERSPNNLLALEVNYSEESWKIDLIDRKKERQTIVEDCGFGTLLSLRLSEPSKVPMEWVDDSRFLYAHYDSLSGLVRIQLKMFDIKNKKEDVIMTLNSVEPFFSNTSFGKDGNNNLIFYGPTKKYRVDTDKKTIVRYGANELGNDFYEGDAQHGFDYFVMHKNDTIGKICCNTYNLKTTNGYFAVEFSEVEKQIHPNGIKVWSESTKKWTTIETSGRSPIIGWYERYE